MIYLLLILKKIDFLFLTYLLLYLSTMFHLEFISYYLYHIKYILSNRECYNKSLSQTNLILYCKIKRERCEDVTVVHFGLYLYCIDTLVNYFNIPINLKDITYGKELLNNEIDTYTNS